MKCWKYKEVSKSIPAIPVIKIILHNLLKTKKYPAEGSSEIKVDTGFDWAVLIPEVVYVELELQKSEIPEKIELLGRTVTGELVKLRKAWGYLEIPEADWIQKVIILTFRGCYKFLIGRKVLENFKFLLNGPDKRGCLISSSI